MEISPRCARLALDLAGVQPFAKTSPPAAQVVLKDALQAAGPHHVAGTIAAEVDSPRCGVPEGPTLYVVGPDVVAHRSQDVIGHAMNLQHRQDTINLLASGTTGWSVNDEEIGKVRSWAAAQDWVLTPADAFKKGHHSFLTKLPGTSKLKSRALKALRKAEGRTP